MQAWEDSKNEKRCVTSTLSRHDFLQNQGANKQLGSTDNGCSHMLLTGSFDIAPKRTKDLAAFKENKVGCASQLVTHSTTPVIHYLRGHAANIDVSDMDILHTEQGKLFGAGVSVREVSKTNV